MSFYTISRNVVKVLLKLVYKIEVNGIENIPTEGSLITCSNHINLLDPPVVAVVLPRNVSFMAKKELFKNKLLGYILNKLGTFPVDREGNDLTAIKKSLKILNKGQVLGIFPEGTRVNEMNLENVKAGVGMLSIKSKSPVVPIFIESTYKPFSKVKVIIGEVLYFDEYYNRKLSNDEYLDISRTIMKKIYSLKSNS